MSKIRLIFACLSVLLLCSCNLIGGKDEIDYFPVKLDKDGRWSMVGPDGTILFLDEFENLPTFVINGVFVVREGETYSVYKASDKPELIIDDLKCVGVMSDGLIPAVKKDGHIIVVSKKGEEKFVLESYNGKDIVQCHDQYSEGLLAFKTENSKWGYVNKAGEVVIHPKYDNVNPFVGKYAVVGIYKESSNETAQYIINKKGETVLEIPQKYIIKSHNETEIKDGLMCVYDSAREKVGFLNIKGEFISVSSKVVSISDFNNDVFVFINKEGKYGVMCLDENRTQLIRPKYENIDIISSNEFLVNYGDEYYVVNEKDEKIIDFSYYDYVVPSPISNTQGYIAKEGNVSVLLDKEGNQVGNTEFYEVCGDKSYYEDGGEDCYGSHVVSDYFNTPNLTNVIEECLTTYVIGESMEKYVTNPEECNLNSYYYKVSNLAQKGSGNKIDIVLVSDLPYIKSGSELYNTKEVNKNSKLVSFEIDIYTLSGCDVWEHSEKIDQQLTNILESQGFKKETDDDVFVKGDIIIRKALTHDSGYCIMISKKEAKKISNRLYSGWGKIANARCKIDLDFALGKGTLSYNTKGTSMFQLNIAELVDYGGVKTYDGLVVNEYDCNGNYTGQMIGEAYDDIDENGNPSVYYQGSYHRRDGKIFDFEFTLTKQ